MTVKKSASNEPGVNLPGYLLATALTAYRRRAKLTHEDLQSMGYGSKSKWSALENCHRPFKINDVAALADLYNCSPDERDQLKQWVQQARSAQWNDGESPHTASDPQWSTYLGSEGLATRIRIASHIVPGLLQAEGYARVAANVPGMTPERLNRVVALRRERQDLHIGRAAVEVAITEESLSRTVGSGRVMREQRQHLLDLAERGADIRVFPMHHGDLPMLLGEVTVLFFSETTGLSPVVFEEGHTGGRYVETPTIVARTIAHTAGMFDPAIPIKEFLS